MLFAHIILAAVTYLSPVHFDVSLAGNFGEPRPNHFHGGLDIKTLQEEGKAVYSIGDGYVSRVTVNVGGMGNAIYIRHPEGYTSVYAHLQRFAPIIEAQVRKWQYQHHETDVDITLEATDCPVAQGQLVALSGDTGASMGPHLHLEIHETSTWNMMDPLDFLPDLLTDSIAPKAHAFMAYPVEGQGVFCGKSEQQRFDFINDIIADSLTAWGKVGFGLYAEDFMQGSYNRYGIRHTALLVDGNEVFSSEIDNIPVSENKMVNVWGDYDYFAKNQQWFLRSFILPGNRLSFLKADKNNGVVNFCQERDYLLTYVLSDFFGNSSRYSFVVMARPDTIRPVEVDDSLQLKMTEENECKTEGMELHLPKGALLNDAKVSPSARRIRNGCSDEFLLARKSIPLYQKASLSLQVREGVEDTEKLYIAARKRDRRNELDPEQDKTVFVGGSYANGWIKGEIDDIGDAFFVALDDTPPSIIPLNQRTWTEEPLLLFDLKDNQSGIKGFEGYLDGEFVLFDHIKKSSRIICDLRDTPVVPKGQERQLRLLARDRIGNESVFDATVLY